MNTLNISGDAVGAEKVDGEGDPSFASPDYLDLSSNKITGDSDLRWMVGAGVGAVRWLDLSFKRIFDAFPKFTNYSGLQYLDMSSKLSLMGIFDDLPILKMGFDYLPL
ncbi:hypothetical protein GUJ93_ZPchr0015g6944 [Zizania palustris]|uniref:Uncharacterized protein n=1 Tax=Zizania palustris TaxID=103762 RepID=A0A8J5THI3_ZIZPA|nr:hypothetical protein GUJ93_ZPchr0015g6944 [Zizania palustris]